MEVDSHSTSETTSLSFLSHLLGNVNGFAPVLTCELGLRKVFIIRESDRLNLHPTVQNHSEIHEPALAPET